MFELAIAIGLYSYLIFCLGVLGLLYKEIVFVLTIIFGFSILWFFRRKKIIKLPNIHKLSWFSIFILILLFLQVFVNFVGALGPEISFDALWYHLTLPKLYLLNNSIFFIPGGLLYYSAIPKLVEMLYVPCLMFFGDNAAKITHLLFGVLSAFVIYRISRNYLNSRYSLLAVLIFYSNLVVGWESVSAYIDLARTFFELLAFLAFLKWDKLNKNNYLVLTGVMIGFAIAVKILSLISFLILLIFIAVLSYNKAQDIKKTAVNVFIFCVISFLVSIPWFIFSFLHTGSPIYPVGFYSLNPKINFLDFSRAFEDPISPLYIIIIPFAPFYYRKLSKLFLLFIYSFIGVIIWYLLIRVGGARYTIPYFAILSIVVSYLVFIIKYKYISNFLQVVIIFVAFVSLSYRALANMKFVPVVLGLESKSTFLTNHLNFSYGDFYDTDGYFKKNIKSSDKVLLYGFHNLYYVDFPFVDSSWIKKGDKFNFIATQNTNLPAKFSNWQRIYYNSLTKVSLYSFKGKVWEY